MKRIYDKVCFMDTSELYKSVAYLLDKTEARQTSANEIITDYLRTHRYLTADERQSILDLVWTVIRARARLLYAWPEQDWLGRVRLLAEQGAHIIKTYYCENFEQITAACPVPIVIAGGKKIPENEALDMAYRAVSQGAAGVDMGRNVLQAECPKAMLRAIRMVVHENAKPEEAFKAYELWKKDVK